MAARSRGLSAARNSAIAASICAAASAVRRVASNVRASAACALASSGPRGRVDSDSMAASSVRWLSSKAPRSHNRAPKCVSQVTIKVGQPVARARSAAASKQRAARS